MLDIVGAGMAGLLAANMLKHMQPVVYEKAKSLPNNHSAVLRFRSSIVGDTLRIPFRKVSMIKDILPWQSPVADALAYSKKCSGTYRSDRSIIGGLTTGDRFIAPDNLISMMEEGLQVRYNQDFDFDEIPLAPVISTIPMPHLMQALHWEHRNEVTFKAERGVNVRARIKNCDAYVSLYVPDPMYPFSRISLTGDELIVECPRYWINGADIVSENEEAKVRRPSDLAELAANCLGIDCNEVYDVRAYAQVYSKIVPIPDDIRKEFLFWATDKHNVYSLGRFATWRPSLLLDDLVNDIRLIEKWTTKGRGRYEAARHR